MKKIKISDIILLILTCLTILYLLNSVLITKQILVYTKLFLEKLFPASFIFFTLSFLLIEYNAVELLTKILNKSGASIYVTIMSMISGFPSGSIYTAKLLQQKQITENTANYLIKFTHFPNPIFILGPVSLLFSKKIYTYKILISIVLANLIIALFTKPKQTEEIKLIHKNKQNFPQILTKAILSSLKTIILIYGTSIFLYLIITIINHYLKMPLIIYILLNGIFDLTNGVFLTSLISIENIKGIIIIFFFAVGGISVHMQSKSIIADTKIKYKNFLIGRLLQVILSITIFLWIINW